MSGAIALDKVESALAQQWQRHREAAGKKGPSSLARTANVVALCANPEDRARVRDVLGRLALMYPGRVLLVVPAEPDASEASITAREAELVLDPQRKNEPVSELVTLDVKGGARAWVPTAVERLLTHGAPVHLWWVGDLPDRDTLFERLVDASDTVLFDSSAMDLRDVPALARLTERRHGGCAVGDLGWSWLRQWQELLARFFDDESERPELERIEEVRLCCAPHRNEPVAEPASTQGALYAGWLLSRLGADVQTARWQRREGDERVLEVRAPGRAITVRFTTEQRANVPTGALVRASLHAPGCSYQVERDADDATTFGWSAETPRATGAPAVWRVRLPDETGLLARAIETPAAGRATLVRSLRAAALIAGAP